MRNREIETGGVPEGARARLEESIHALAESSALVRAEQVRRVLSQADRLVDSREGLEFLYEFVPELVEAGLFRDGPWAEPGRLVPALVAGTLRAGGQSALMETLSELRMVALAEERIHRRGFSARRARQFLEEMMVRSFDLVLLRERLDEGTVSAATEADPDEIETRRILALMAFLRDRVPLAALRSELANEISLLCLQRPVVTDRALELLRLVRDHVPFSEGLRTDEGSPDDGEPEWEDPDPERRLAFYLDQAFTPSDSVRLRNASEYVAFLDDASGAELESECDALGRSMARTGLAIAHHALLARRVRSNRELLARLLGLGAGGRAELGKHHGLVQDLVEAAVHPGLPRACHGLSRFLERGLLEQQPVRAGLRRLLDLELDSTVGAALDRVASSPEPAAVLLADVLGVLGQPLGVGQGRNPTCQSARGISLWSRHAPGKLLGMILNVARTNDLSMRFEGHLLRASELGEGLVKEFNPDLDAVSVLLVPHLDRIYNEMMRRAAFRGEDPHKWVNPAMYGHWIPTGFGSAYDYATDSIREYDAFLRTFYATHHPDFNHGHDLAYPNPVGIFLTSVTGDLIGFHAVSVLRVRRIRGQVRVYLFNPNSEGRQRWHANIRPTVAGNGERPGESSLPFHEFASILYAFHYSPSDVGPLDAVEDDEIDRVTELARSSWGRAYTWMDGPLAPSLPGAGG